MLQQQIQLRQRARNNSVGAINQPTSNYAPANTPPLGGQGQPGYDSYNNNPGYNAGYGAAAGAAGGAGAGAGWGSPPPANEGYRQGRLGYAPRTNYSC